MGDSLVVESTEDGEGVGEVQTRKDEESVRNRRTRWRRDYLLPIIHSFIHFLLFQKLHKIAIIIPPDPNSLFREDPIPRFVSPTPNCCQAEQRISS